jgi:hypothetical protein
MTMEKTSVLRFLAGAAFCEPIPACTGARKRESPLCASRSEIRTGHGLYEHPDSIRDPATSIRTDKKHIVDVFIAFFL